MSRCRSKSCFALRSAFRSSAVIGNATTLSSSPPVLGLMLHLSICARSPLTTGPGYFIGHLYTHVHEHIRRRVALPLKYWQSRRAKFCATIIVGLLSGLLFNRVCGAHSSA